LPDSTRNPTSCVDVGYWGMTGSRTKES
jgi:hypothetical protein